MNVPCRVSVDLRLHQAQQAQAEPSDRFDEFDEMHVAAVVPHELVKPVMGLLQTRRLTPPDGSPLREDLDRLYRACVDRWRDL